jgi:GT2 family glycosyltransferase
MHNSCEDNLPGVSVIILTYNSAPFIARCLESLSWQSYPSSFQIIVVDNHSTDDTIERIQQGQFNPIVIRNATNRGCAGGNNDGWHRSDGEILVFLNPDTEARPDWLKSLVAPFAHDPAVAITGCKIYYPNSHTLQHAGGILYPNAMSDHYGNQQEDTGQYDTEREVDYVTGAAFAVRRSFLEAVGGFDEDYSPAYYEETDLCYKARKRGLKVLYVPSAVIHHHESPALRRYSPAFYRTYYRSRIRFLLKNYSLHDWLVRFLPFELKWFFVPESRGTRLIQFWAYLEGLKFCLKKCLKSSGKESALSKNQ